jgi:hypothetical protein
MAKRRKIDWETVENLYRAGQLSIREIARQNGCAAQTIVDRAKRYDWSRDLSEKVRQAIRAKLAKADTDSLTDTDKAKRQKDIVEGASDKGVEVIKLHRKDISSLKELEAQLIEELKNKPTKLYITQYQGEIVEKVVGLTAAERSQAANNLANVQHKRIQLERQAFNLNEGSEDSEVIFKVKYENRVLKEEDGS